MASQSARWPSFSLLPLLAALGFQAAVAMQLAAQLPPPFQNQSTVSIHPGGRRATTPCVPIKNGGFEEGALGSIPTHFQRWNGLGTTGLVSSTFAHTGTKSAEFSGSGSWQVLESLDRGYLDSGTWVFTVSLWAYADIPGCEAASGWIFNYSDPVGKLEALVAGQWTFHTHTLVTNGNGNYPWDIILLIGSPPTNPPACRVFIDDVAVGDCSATPPAAPTSYGDPHVSNLRGQQFDLQAPGLWTYLRIPRSAQAGGRGGGKGGAEKAEDGALLLEVQASVEPLGSLCQSLFVTGLRFRGRWVLPGRALHFATSLEAEMGAKALKIQLMDSKEKETEKDENEKEKEEKKKKEEKEGNEEKQDSKNEEEELRRLTPTQLADLGPAAGVLAVEEFQPAAPPGAVNQHVTLVMIKLKLGPAIAKVRMVYQKEKDKVTRAVEGKEGAQTTRKAASFSNSLWLTVTGLQEALGEGGEESIGGILGFDDHSAAAEAPKECQEPRARLVAAQTAGRVEATAEL